MKELDDFTVERLQAITQQPDSSTIFMYEVRALARIALAAKTAQPVAWWTGPEPTLTGEIESIHDHETGGHYLPLISIGTTSEAALSRETFIFKVANFLCTRRQSIAREVETASMIYDMVNPQGIEKQKTSIRDGILKLREHAELLGGYNHDALVDELSAPVLNSPELPDGWKLVPIEPTEGMVIDGFESEAWDALGDAVLDKKGWPYSCRESAECVTGIFKAMLAAAPTPPTTEK